jgi:hypothetical protein
MTSARFRVVTKPRLRIRLSISLLIPAALAAAVTVSKQATYRSTGLVTMSISSFMPI